MGGERNIKLILEYDGTNYHGWQVQKGKATIQEIIEERLSRITQERIKTICAGRTDAGVHALGQVINFRTHSTMKEEEFKRALNSLLPSDIVVLDGEEVGDDFNARLSARSRVYRYTIVHHPSAFLRHYAWYLPYSLDVDAMKLAAAFLIGTHDFSAFRASSCRIKNPRRHLERLEVERDGEALNMVFEANAFLQHMVRTLVGTLVYVGRGKIFPQRVKEILVSRDRRNAGPTAPAHGLFLERVIYL